MEALQNRDGSCGCSGQVATRAFKIRVKGFRVKVNVVIVRGHMVGVL